MRAEESKITPKFAVGVITEVSSSVVFITALYDVSSFVILGLDTTPPPPAEIVMFTCVIPPVASSSSHRITPEQIGVLPAPFFCPLVFLDVAL